MYRISFDKQKHRLLVTIAIGSIWPCYSIVIVKIVPALPLVTLEQRHTVKIQETHTVSVHLLRVGCMTHMCENIIVHMCEHVGEHPSACQCITDNDNSHSALRKMCIRDRYNTPPIPTHEASVAILNCLLKSGNARSGAVAIAFLTRSKERVRDGRCV